LNIFRGVGYMCREKTVEEIRDEFVDHVGHLVDYWDTLPDKSCREKLEGLAHSILTTIDGESVALPGYIMIPNSCLQDRDFHIEENENYYPVIDEKSPVRHFDIAGCLHEVWSRHPRNIE